jgi:hypothetical protein
VGRDPGLDVSPFALARLSRADAAGERYVV